MTRRARRQRFYARVRAARFLRYILRHDVLDDEVPLQYRHLVD